MDLINWELSAATALAGQQTANYPYYVFLMDTSELDILLNNPESHEAYTYFNQHCIVSHLCNANSRSGSNFLPVINLSFAQYLQKHRGRYADDGTTVHKIVPNSIEFGEVKPLPISFYQSQHSLFNNGRIMPLTFGAAVGGEIIQTFDTQVVRQVVYATWNSSAGNQRPHTVRIQYLDEDDVWRNGPDIVLTTNALTVRTVDLNVVCKAVKIFVSVQNSGQVGWAVDTFYCIGDGVYCPIEEPQAVLICPLMYGQTIYPTTLPWATTRTPVFQFDRHEVELNRDQTDPHLPIIMLTDQIVLEAIT